MSVKTQSIKLTKEDLGCELLPCPFCGSTDVELSNTWTPAYSVECNNCEASRPGEYYANWNVADEAYENARHVASALSAVEGWNTRNTPSQSGNQK